MSTPIYPFQFSRYVRERLKGGSFVASSSGCTVTDLDGNQFYDLTGSYGVNVFGNDFYKECIDSGNARARARWGRCWAPISPARWTTRGACARFPDSTRFRSTCPEPRR